MPDFVLPSSPYKSPPITEAVIGINFLSPIKQPILVTVNKKFQTHYPDHQIVSNFNVAVDLKVGKTDNPATTNIKKEDGHRRSAENMTQLLVLWPSSIIVSQLAPYQGWDNFFDRFKRDWGLWKRVVGFQEISRIGVRYINRIDIPVAGPVVEHEQFLNVYPKLPDSLSPVFAYAVQVATELRDIGCILRVNSAAVPSPILGHASFVVDIDISKEVGLPQSDKDIYDLLSIIRVHKNVVFESCITSRARELFQ